MSRGMGVDQLGEDEIGVDEMGVDEKGSRRSGMTSVNQAGIYEQFMNSTEIQLQTT